MVKHTQTIRRQIADELFECIWPFYGIDVLRVNEVKCDRQQFLWLFPKTRVGKLLTTKHRECSMS